MSRRLQRVGSGGAAPVGSTEATLGGSFRPSVAVAALVSSLMHRPEAPLRGLHPVRWPTLLRAGIRLTNDRIARLLGILLAFLTIADVSNREFIAGFQTAGLDPPAVDPDAISAAKVTDLDLIILACHAAVMPRNSQRVELGVTIGITAHDDHGTVQSDVWAFIDSDES